MDLSEFLLARIAEDEHVARRASGHDLFDGTGIVPDHSRFGGSSAVLPSHIAVYVAAWDPTRAQAECAAKRRIIQLHRDLLADEERFHEDMGGASLTQVLQCLALPYADHPDYDKAWAPSGVG